MPLKVTPNPKLGAELRKAIERDYATTGGTLKLKVRKAMEGYLHDRLGLAVASDTLAVRLLEMGHPPNKQRPQSVPVCMKAMFLSTLMPVVVATTLSA